MTEAFNNKTSVIELKLVHASLKQLEKYVYGIIFFF